MRRGARPSASVKNPMIFFSEISKYIMMIFSSFRKIAQEANGE
jgi:hypothetical protein